MTDLISRADALAYPIRIDHYDREHGNLHFVLGIESVMEYIENLPSAETHEIRTETHGVCSDLISREDAMSAVQDHFNADGFKGYDDGQQMMDRIKALPSAEGGDAEMTVIPEGTGLMKPCPNGADLISRELAMERIANDNVVGGMERINEFNNSTEFNDYLDGISDAITTIFCDVPSAEAVQGEWGHMIADGSDGSHWYEYECSHCGEVVLRPWNFCPNCGAKMHKGEDTTGESL